MTAWNGISILRGTTSLRSYSESYIHLKCDLCAVCLSFSFLSFFGVVECMKKGRGAGSPLGDARKSSGVVTVYC